MFELLQWIVAVLSRWEVLASFTAQKFFGFRKCLLEMGLRNFMTSLANMAIRHEKVSSCRSGELPTKYLLKQLLIVGDFG